MNTGTVVPKSVNLGETATILMRCVGALQTLITQASLTSITRRTVNTTTGVVIETGTVVVIATSVFDTGQTDEGWANAAAPYNFKDRITASSAGNVTVEYSFTDTSSRVTIGTAKLAVNALP